MTRRFAGLALAFCVLLAGRGQAQEIKAGSLVINAPWSRATPKGAPVGAGYLTIHNAGTEPERLLGGHSEAARDVQVHEMTMDGGVMKMRQLEAGLVIAPGATVELKPGGYHLMLLNLNHPFVKGEKIGITLDFEHAGKVPVDFAIGGLGDSGPGQSTGEMKDMGGMKMSH